MELAFTSTELYMVVVRFIQAVPTKVSHWSACGHGFLYSSRHRLESESTSDVIPSSVHSFIHCIMYMLLLARLFACGLVKSDFHSFINFKRHMVRSSVHKLVLFPSTWSGNCVETSDIIIVHLKGIYHAEREIGSISNVGVIVFGPQRLGKFFVCDICKFSRVLMNSAMNRPPPGPPPGKSYVSTCCMLLLFQWMCKCKQVPYHSGQNNYTEVRAPCFPHDGY